MIFELYINKYKFLSSNNKHCVRSKTNFVTMPLIWNILQINLTDLSPLWNRNLHFSFSCFSNEIFVNLILLISVFVKFDYLQMLPTTIWRKLCVFSKDFSFLKSTFQLNEHLSAFVSKNVSMIYTLDNVSYIAGVALLFVSRLCFNLFYFLNIYIFLWLCIKGQLQV